ncbi:molting protein mlt-4 [Anaeramoeba flamelloides]|uniref:Molting protein mlt-4 n=1 Tax=Anaeramoeba flamelloides TaxID=1746091 RepID=A0ABQ8Y7K8_9EUKA|nr:molting protein mlt-4 [Anaeramoeba flamelloides]
MSKQLLKLTKSSNFTKEECVDPLFWSGVYEGKTQLLKNVFSFIKDTDSVVQKKTTYGDIGLHFSVLNSTNNIDTLKLLLSLHSNPNAKNDLSLSPLHIACINGLPESVEELLQNKADPDLVSKSGMSIVHHCCEFGRLECLKVLLKYNAKINSYLGNTTPLMIACRNGHSNLIPVLLENKCSVSETKTFDKKTALHLAALNGHTKCCELLIENGAEADCKDRQNLTPLLCASQNSHLETVKFLLEKGANSNNQDRFGNTPLHYSTKNQNTEISKILLEFNSDTNIQNEKGYSPLHIASKIGNAINILLLLDRGADAYLSDIKNNTCIDLLLQKQHHEILLLVMDSIFINAAYYRNMETFNKLIQRGVDVNGSTFRDYLKKNHVETNKFSFIKNRYSDPLIACVAGNNVEGIITLFKRLVNHRSRDIFNGYTALHQAIVSDNLKIVKMLIEKGSKQSIEDKDDDNDLMCYSRKNNKNNKNIYGLGNTNYNNIEQKPPISPLELAKKLKRDQIAKYLTQCDLIQVTTRAGEKFPRVVYATEDKIIEYFLTDTNYNQDFIESFLLMHIYFITSENLFINLLTIYNHIDPFLLNVIYIDPDLKDPTSFIRTQIIKLIKTWVTVSYIDFQKSRKFKKKLEKFLSNQSSSYPDEVKLINKIINRQQLIMKQGKKKEAKREKQLTSENNFKEISSSENDLELFESNQDPNQNSEIINNDKSNKNNDESNGPPTPIIPMNLQKKMKKLNQPMRKRIQIDLLMDCDALELARQLTLIKFRYFKRIQKREFKDWIIEKKKQNSNQKSNTKIIKNMLEYHNYSVSLISWFSYQIVKETKKNKRIKRVQKLVLIAKACKELQNYATMMEIITALQSKEILRLTKTWKGVNKIQITICKEIKNEIEEFSIGNQFINFYRQANPPCIPYLENFFNSIQKIENDFLNKQSKKIHGKTLIPIGVYHKQFEMINIITKFQKCPYHLKRVQYFAFELQNFPSFTNERLLELSLFAEKN